MYVEIFISAHNQPLRKADGGFLFIVIRVYSDRFSMRRNVIQRSAKGVKCLEDFWYKKPNRFAKEE